MRIAVVCNDTRGGVQPYVALARGLREAGHAVTAIAPEDLLPMFDAAGVRGAALEGSVEAVMRASQGVAEKGALAAMRFGAAQMERLLPRWTRATLEACEGTRAEVITGGIGGSLLARGVAERMGVPFVETHLQPLDAPTDAYPGPLFGSVPRWLGAVGMRASHRLSSLALWTPFRGPVKRARRAVLGLDGDEAPLTTPVLYGFSRRVVPVPDEGPRRRHVTGYWVTADEAWRAPAALQDFLARGDVVSIGFGSMSSADAKATTALVLDAVRRAGVRAVLLQGWGGIEADGARDDVYVADAMPHTWLFPRVAAVVHHGGAGTTGAALRAGVPAVVVPFMMDQVFWGGRVAALGVGPEPVSRRRLTAERLAEALRRAVGDGAMRSRAAALGEALRAEDGVGNAVAVFNAMARS